jgi:hypothetical protein
MFRRIALVLGVVAMFVVDPNVGRAQTIDLTGVWHTQTGATFFVRQMGPEIWWYGTQSLSQPRWTNVASGRLDSNVIRVRWIDVPQGATRNSGTLALRAVSPNRLVVIENPNDFLAADWTR